MDLEAIEEVARAVFTEWYLTNAEVDGAVNEFVSACKAFDNQNRKASSKRTRKAYMRDYMRDYMKKRRQNEAQSEPMLSTN